MRTIRKATTAILWGIAGIVAFFFAALEYTALYAMGENIRDWFDPMIKASAALAVVGFVLIIAGVAICDKQEKDYEKTIYDLCEAAKKSGNHDHV